MLDFGRVLIVSIFLNSTPRLVLFYFFTRKYMVSQLNARHKPKYELLTFYKFVDIPEVELDRIAQEHLDFTRDIGLKGRVYLGTEGISSTVTGNI